MSKPSSGLFKGTNGSKYSSSLLQTKKSKPRTTTTKNKIEHILGKKNINKHNLGDVLKENGNNKKVAYNSVNKTIQDYVKNNNIADGLIIDKVNYNGHTITFKGIVKEGSYKPGTFYITEEDYKNEKKRIN